MVTSHRPNANYTQSDGEDEFFMTMLLKDEFITRAMEHTLHDQDNTLAQWRPNVVQRWADIEPALCILWFGYGLVLVSPSKHGALDRCCLDVGPSSTTLVQHWDDIGWTPCVCWAGCSFWEAQQTQVFNQCCLYWSSIVEGGRTLNWHLLVYLSCTPVSRTSVPHTHSQWRCHFLRQGEKTKFDRFVDPNVRDAKRWIYSDLRIYCNWVLSST